MHREPRVLEAEAQVRKWLDCRARITSNDFAQLHSVKNGIFRSACSTKQKMNANLGISAITHTDRLTNSLARSQKIMVTKLQWLYWRIHDNWVAYFKIWSRRSLQRFCGRAQTYWSQSDVFKIHQSRVTSRQHSRPKTNAWNNLPRWSSNAPKFEDRSQEETEKQ